MRYLLFLSLFPAVLFGCKGNDEPTVVVKGQSITELPVRPEKVAGMYTGEFKGSPLVILLSDVTASHASGYSRHKGISRNVNGVVDFDSGRLHLYLVEPGDSRFDGQFHMAIDTANWKGQGSWKSFVTGTEIPFRFQKREIVHDDSSRVFIDASSNYIVLRPDGSCTYSYQTDTTNRKAPVLIDGQYKKTNNIITISWQKHPQHATGKAMYRLMSEKAYKGENYTQEILRGEGKEFHELLFN
jgi:hypothetical protein